MSRRRQVIIEAPPPGFVATWVILAAMGIIVWFLSWCLDMTIKEFIVGVIVIVVVFQAFAAKR
jgi:hypothetical protein